MRRLLAPLYGAMERAYWDRTYARYRDRHELDPTFCFEGDRVLIRGGGTVAAGPGSYLSRGCLLYVHKGTRIEIGRDVRIGQNVRIDTQSTVAHQDRRVGHEVKAGDVRIGDFAWLGIGAYVGPGVSIGENAVVGANAVINSDLAADTVTRPVMETSPI